MVVSDRQTAEAVVQHYATKRVGLVHCKVVDETRPRCEQHTVQSRTCTILQVLPKASFDACHVAAQRPSMHHPDGVLFGFLSRRCAGPSASRHRGRTRWRASLPAGEMTHRPSRRWRRCSAPGRWSPTARVRCERCHACTNVIRNCQSVPCTMPCTMPCMHACISMKLITIPNDHSALCSQVWHEAICIRS